jgi:hypothetical protein
LRSWFGVREWWCRWGYHRSIAASSIWQLPARQSESLPRTCTTKTCLLSIKKTTSWQLSVSVSSQTLLVQTLRKPMIQI